MNRDGYIKYSSTLRPEDPVSDVVLAEINRARTELFDRKLIGIYPDGIGYGNCSVRHGESFYITGSATGHRRVLAPAQYTRVARISLSENRVWAFGSIPASSESMTHGVIYQADPDIHAVIHVHSRTLFDFLLAANASRTPPEAAFGTPEMAEALRAVVQANTERPGLCVMTGHEEGVIAYGPTVAPVLSLLKSAYERA